MKEPWQYYTVNATPTNGLSENAAWFTNTPDGPKLMHFGRSYMMAEKDMKRLMLAYNATLNLLDEELLHMALLATPVYGMMHLISLINENPFVQVGNVVHNVQSVEDGSVNKIVINPIDKTDDGIPFIEVFYNTKWRIANFDIPSTNHNKASRLSVFVNELNTESFALIVKSVFEEYKLPWKLS